MDFEILYCRKCQKDTWHEHRICFACGEPQETREGRDPKS